MTATNSELEAALRQLFSDHEHLADDSAPTQLAAKAAGAGMSDRRRRLVLALAAAVLLMTGAVVTQQVRGVDRQPTPATPAALPPGRLGDALRTFETSWATAKAPKLVLLGPLYPEVRGGLTTDDKLILNGGLVAADDVLPSEPLATGVVRGSDGTRGVVTVISAAESLESARTAAKSAIARSCTVCEPRVVTGATLTTTVVPSANGDVAIPAWSFALDGTSTTVVMSAVSPTQIVAPVASPLSSPSPTAYAAVVSDDGRELTLEFTGEPPDCSLAYSATAARSTHAVAVLIETHGEQCAGPDVGYIRHITVRLDQPFGDAVVIDGQVGNPIPVQR